MIRHCVFARFRNDVAATERTAVHADLEALRQLIDGMDAVKFSANVSPEPFARGFTHGFTIDFRDAAARDAYLVHEAHQRAGARLVAALEGGTDGLMVFDLEI
ncbi:Dabb family protein [Mesorhizobium sp. M7A.F.Ca.CA.001.09.2.1]|uniref:Stress responsive alpha-beta barrel domain-containing protein n=2 Tax=Mesorhizobium ciceri TaxID=39645 RepID=E8TDW1_MESCW|nr:MULTISPECIES: Dabb family protein [Mesorhizobium]RUY57671.1 Dabb family protein [Mesorhizobium sp. M7A.F.Ca.CA.001.13.2.1]RUZ80426.1 Dabb family protein [Mesorhizobium sp. M7A.F.Ca.US.003.02.2.1]RVA57948.1 Dabb family protein [Mesorhizobium sp. M7A.F.Ca.US.001.01.1.1]ADV11004.1 Stress responsive alpha-beta barrel domain-containing protein [Mesorhizobium ciceri biovar biserrulae WSM1271]AMY02256.1 stress responsive protein [Mesorhizobium ciceri biovar biserrulae]